VLLTKWNTSSVPVTTVVTHEKARMRQPSHVWINGGLGVQHVMDQGQLQLDQLVQCVVVITVGYDDASLVRSKLGFVIDELTHAEFEHAVC